MSKTQDRCEKLATLLDEAIIGGNHERIESLYGVFQQEREYLNVELNIEIDDLGDPVPGADEVETCPHSIGRYADGEPKPCGKPVAEDDNLCERHADGRRALDPSS